MEPLKPDLKVLLPPSLDESNYIGDLFGYYHPASGVFNILAWDEETRKSFSGSRLDLIGRIVASGNQAESGTDLLLGYRTGEGLQFQVGGSLCKKEFYNLLQNVFSRNTGILETDWMLDKTAFVLGCGSVGSLVALELARAGVGNFVLVDNDIFNYHNICRHQCGIHEVGEYKVQAMRERILEINPLAKVYDYISTLEMLPKDTFDKHCRPGTILISCADNRDADHYSSKMARTYSIPFVSIGLWERAFAGEIFYFLPQENMPCYECAIGKGQGTARQSVSRRVYTTQENLEEVNFEPGISVDIDYVTLIAIKLILDLFNYDNPRFTPRLINRLTQYTLICNTNETAIGGELAEIFSYPLQVTTSIKVSFKSPCPPCRYS
ncbi:MAG: ThiF family adenylyltransferase [Chloroflexi bacterium]|nr:ThiF family adenylyltransferase [Chloroflexota bacterium]